MRVNVGTVGHIDHGKSTLTSLLLAVAAAGFLHHAQPAVLPTRRREFEPGTDMNHLLDDAGLRAARALRKAARRERLLDLQRIAVEGCS